MMPANLTPQYYAAEQAYKQAKTVDEKIDALEEMLAVIPKHKGTEKLQADLKRRLAKLRKEGEKKSKTSREDPFHVEKEGAGQVLLLGFPNSGKSSLVGALTRAKVTISDYPFATQLPVAGMMPYEDIWIQLVDTPPITADMIQPGLVGTLKAADALLIIIDTSSDDCLDQLEGCMQLLRKKRVLDLDEETAPGPHRLPFSRCLVVATKADAPQSQANMSILQEFIPAPLQLVPVSTATGANLEQLRQRIFEMLEVIRVYSKIPGREPDMRAPFVLKKGSTVLDMARAVHRDFPEKLKHARIWGSARFDGQSVSRDYVLQDRDIVELHVYP